MRLPFRTLRFLYVGSSDVPRDLDYYTQRLGAQKEWHHRAFGAEVAAVRLGPGPLVLLADHRPAGTCMPVYEVEDFTVVTRALRRRGWTPEGEAFEIPNGPCHVFEDPSGNRFAFFQDVRPHALEERDADAEPVHVAGE